MAGQYSTNKYFHREYPLTSVDYSRDKSSESLTDKQSKIKSILIPN